MDFIQLRTFDNYIEANIVMNMLRSSSINCHLKDENIITIDPLLSPALGGMKLMVHHSQVERAWDMMENAEHEYLKSIPCPVCKSHTLIKEVITKKHSCKLRRACFYVIEWTFCRSNSNLQVHQLWL